jgi:hypothetical protein
MDFGEVQRCGVQAPQIRGSLMSCAVLRQAASAMRT